MNSQKVNNKNYTKPSGDQNNGQEQNQNLKQNQDQEQDIDANEEQADFRSKENKETKETRLTQAIKKIFTAGVSGALLSEEMLKSYLAEIKMPKELMQVLLQGAQKSKSEISNRVSQELIQIFSNLDWAKIGSDFLENHKVTMKVEIDFKKKNQGKNDDALD